MKNPIESCINLCQMMAKPIAKFGLTGLIVLGLSSNPALAQNPPLQVSGLCTTDLSLEFVTAAEEDVANGLLGWTDGNSGNTYTDVHGLGIDIRIDAFEADGVTPKSMDYRGAVRALFSLDNPNGIQWIIVISAFETGTSIPVELNDFAFTAEDFEFRPDVGFEGLERITRVTTRDAAGVTSEINIQNDATATAFSGDVVYSNGGFSIDGPYQFTNVASPDKWVRVALPFGNYHQIEVVGEQVANGGQPAFSLCNPNGADRGDAPISYMDAAHFIDDSNVHFLGTTAPDLEFEAIWEAYPSDASGDNVNGIDDEDGVSFSTAVLGEVLTITATANGANGLLQGWIDWNQNGTFDPAEQIATNVADNSAADTDATVGTIVLEVPVPTTATLGDTFARFRWSTDTDLDATESTENGEVEDYLLGVVTPADIVVSKTLTGETGSIANVAEPGETLTYSITFTNSGGVVVDYAMGDITETVPANTSAAGGDDFSCVAGDPAASTCTNSAAFSVPASNGGTPGTFSLTFSVIVDDPIPGDVRSILNTVVVPDECPVAGNPQGVGNDCDETTPTAPQLVTVKSVLDGNTDGIAQAGETLTYTISVTNSGGSLADDVSITDLVNDPGITVNGGQALVIANASDITPAAPTITNLQAGITMDIAAGDTATVMYSVVVTDPIAVDDTSIDNLVAVTDDGSDICLNPASDCDSTIPTPTPTPAEISVAKTLTAGGPVAEPGEMLTYTISFVNTGGSAITYAAGEIVETVPNNSSATGGDFTCTPDNSAGNSCTAGALTIAAGTTETLTFIVQVDDPIPAGVTSIDNVIVVPGECPGGDCDTSTPTPPPPLPPEVVPVLSPAGYISLALGMLLLSILAFRQRQIDSLQP